MTTPKTAFIFPGQGSQTVGMAADLVASNSAAASVIADVDTALASESATTGESSNSGESTSPSQSPSLSKLMAEGPAETLTLTRNAQPALMATSMAAVRALEATTGKPLAQLGDYVAGHSLGEYTALTAAGVFDIATAARLLRLRGDAMQNAVAIGDGAMAVLLGAELTAVEKFLAGLATQYTPEVANDNSPGQIVISGKTASIQTAIDEAKSSLPNLKRAMLLPVSAPFHCRLMAPAADTMAKALADTTLNIPAIPIFTNVSAAPQTDPTILRRQLVDQITARVRWRETLLAMAAAGVSRFIELGTGKVLSGLVKRTLPEAQVFNLDTAHDLATVAGELV